MEHRVVSTLLRRERRKIGLQRTRRRAVMLATERAAQEQLLMELQGRALAQREEIVRDDEPDVRDWAFQYADRPRAFMGEIIGDDWFTPGWQAWRAFISTVFNEPLMTAGEFHLFKRCTHLTEQPTKRPTSVWLPCGRRAGKSRILSAVAVYLACCYDWTHHLVPGEIGVLPVLAQDRRSAGTIMSYIKAFLEHPKLAPLVVKEQVESILLEGDILIEVVTASYRAIRNRTVVASLLDECAFWRSEEDSANPDHAVLEALEPATATIPNALILAASSPYAQRGILWDAFEKHYGKPDGPLVWKAPTRVMNPSVPEEFIATQYADDPIAAAAEYGAEFRSDIDAFVSRDVLDAVMMRGIHEIPFMHNTYYKAFVDPSGGSSDSMTLAIGHLERDGRRAILDVLREVRPPFSPEAVVEQFAQTLREYKITRVRGDYYGGEWPRDRFLKCGIGYDVSEMRKSEIYLEFLPLINAGRVSLLDEHRMYGQLLNLERRTSRGGLESIDHPKGAHDDVANVAAGVMVELLGKRDPTNIDPSVLRRSAMLRQPPTPRLGSRPTPRW